MLAFRLPMFRLFLFPIYRAIQIFYRRGRAIDIRARRGVSHVRVCAVLGSGGHTTEMIRIIKCFHNKWRLLLHILQQFELYVP